MSLLVEPEQKKRTAFDVLIIDDDPEVLDVMKEHCAKLNYFRNVVVARDGAEAFIKLSNQRFRLILLDLKLPKKSGVDLLKQLKTTANRLNDVVIVSGMVGPAETQVLLKSGIRHIMVKPFREEDFISKIKTILDIT